MPYYIAVYDVSTERVGKMLKLFRRYLHHVQFSVFEGDLTPAQYKELEAAAKSLMREADSVIFYACRTEQHLERMVLGAERRPPDRFL